MFLNSYHYIPLNYTLALKSSSLALSIWVLFFSLMQSVNGEQFLTVAPLILLCVYFAASTALSPIIKFLWSH